MKGRNIGGKIFELGSRRSEPILKKIIARFWNFKASVTKSLLKYVPHSWSNFWWKSRLSRHLLQLIEEGRNPVTHNTHCLAKSNSRLYIGTPHWPTENNRRTERKDELLRKKMKFPKIFHEFCVKLPFYPARNWSQVRNVFRTTFETEEMLHFFNLDPRCSQLVWQDSTNLCKKPLSYFQGFTVAKYRKTWIFPLFRKNLRGNSAERN